MFWFGYETWRYFVNDFHKLFRSPDSPNIRIELSRGLQWLQCLLIWEAFPVCVFQFILFHSRVVANLLHWLMDAGVPKRPRGLIFSAFAATVSVVPYRTDADCVGSFSPYWTFHRRIYQGCTYSIENHTELPRFTILVFGRNHVTEGTSSKGVSYIYSYLGLCRFFTVVIFLSGIGRLRAALRCQLSERGLSVCFINILIQYGDVTGRRNSSRKRVTHAKRSYRVRIN